MIKKFINNDMSEKEVDAMMINFFERKEELDFRNKWHNIIRKSLKQYDNDNSLIFFLRKHIYASASAAVLIILIGAFSFTYFAKETPISNDYIMSSKGVDMNYNQINELINKQNLAAGSQFSADENLFSTYYNDKNYEKVITGISNLLKNDKITVSDRILFIGGISAIKKSEYEKSIEFLKQIPSGSEYTADAKKLIVLLNR